MWNLELRRMPTASHEVARTAAVEARVLARARWASEAIGNNQRWVNRLRDLTRQHRRPVGSKPRETAALDNNFYPAAPLLHTASRHATALSVRGPGCSGGILAYVNTVLGHAAYKAVWAARGGTRALYYWPFGRSVPSTESKQCPLCDLRRQPDTYHVLVACTHSSMALARVSTAKSCLRATLRIAKLCLLTEYPTGTFKHGQQLPAAVERRLADLRALTAPYYYEGTMPSAAWSSDRGRMLLFKLLTVTPWGRGQPPDWLSDSGHPIGGASWDELWEDRPQPDPDALQSLLGSIFDDTVAKPNRLRPLARYWVEWAAEEVRHMAAAWVAATDKGAPCPAQVDQWHTEYQTEPSWRARRSRQQAEHGSTSGYESSADTSVTSISEYDYDDATESSDEVSSDCDSDSYPSDSSDY